MSDSRTPNPLRCLGKSGTALITTFAVVQKAAQAHFADGGTFDQIYQPGRKGYDRLS